MKTSAASEFLLFGDTISPREKVLLAGHPGDMTNSEEVSALLSQPLNQDGAAAATHRVHANRYIGRNINQNVDSDREDGVGPELPEVIRNGGDDDDDDDDNILNTI